MPKDTTDVVAVDAQAKADQARKLARYVKGARQRWQFILPAIAPRLRSYRAETGETMPAEKIAAEFTDLFPLVTRKASAKRGLPAGAPLPEDAMHPVEAWLSKLIKDESIDESLRTQFSGLASRIAAVSGFAAPTTAKLADAITEYAEPVGSVDEL